VTFLTVSVAFVEMPVMVIGNWTWIFGLNKMFGAGLPQPPSSAAPLSHCGCAEPGGGRLSQSSLLCEE